MTHTISGQTALLGVLGDPVRHSLSPVMHNAALRALGLDWIYLALPVAAAELATVVRGLEAVDCRGLNVTLPHKQAVAALAAELSPLARRVGAVNTLVRRKSGGWLGTNTDVDGFLAPLRQAAAGGGAAGWSGRRAVLLGCGGSARAVVAGLTELGLGRITVAARDPGRLAAFQASCGDWAPALDSWLWSTPAGGGDGNAAAPGSSLAERLNEADLVVNSTPVGMGVHPLTQAALAATAATGSTPCPAAARSPLAAAELAALRPGTLVYDLIYTPRPTPLLHDAANRGCRTQDGLEMLVQQGAAALQLWLQAAGQALPVPVDAMREAATAWLAAPTVGGPSPG